ncbi:MAG TPA: AAA family ATPase [Chloroflexota bacterium]|nr:AAA family ATPase [Chloroflexota bacterium]
MVAATSFGEWLTLRRQNLHLQRTELATRTGCAVVTLRKIEADERRPSREFAERLASELGIPPPQHEVFVRVARGELPVSRLEPAASPNAGPSNLPSATTTLIGREAEIAQVQSSFSRPEVRLLTLTGAPGVGKSRLALEVASRLRGAFADGVFFVPLAPLSDPAHVLVTVAHALNLGISGQRPVAERLGRYLRNRQVLLVLDNFEHVLLAAPQLTQLLRGAPQVKVLVTSRTALELSGEHRFVVRPLSAPAAPDSMRRSLISTATPERYAAVNLLIERARSVHPSLALTEANLWSMGEIARRLDGLPLAIELVGARAALFSPQELLARLDARFTLLTPGARDVPARHMSVGRAIDWSYSLLSPAGQRAFRHLSVFAGGCTLEGAEAVCGDGTLEHEIDSAIVGLVDGSLVQRQEGPDGRSRFEMLETIRAYAAQQLAASGESEIARQRHAAYYVRIAEAAEQAWDQPAEWDWLRRLVSERDNVRAALRWMLEARDASTALRFNAALFSFWTTCSVLSEAHGWLEASLALPRSDPTPELLRAEAKVLNVAGYTAAESGEHARAIACFERGLALYREVGDRRGIAWSIRGCAFARMLHDEYAAAEQLLNDSLQLCRATGDGWGEAWSLYALAFLKLAVGDLAQARFALEGALLHLRRENIPFGLFRALLALGHVRLDQGDVATAEALYREALQISREAPLLTFITIGVEGLAAVATTQGRPVRAARLWGAAEALREATDEQRWHVFERTYESALTSARSQLSPLDWVTAWNAGRALTSQQAVAEALEDR